MLNRHNDHERVELQDLDPVVDPMYGCAFAEGNGSMMRSCGIRRPLDFKENKHEVRVRRPLCREDVASDERNATVTCTNHGCNRKMESLSPPSAQAPPVPCHHLPHRRPGTRCMGQPVAHLAVRSSQNPTNTRINSCKERTNEVRTYRQARTTLARSLWSTVRRFEGGKSYSGKNLEVSYVETGERILLIPGLTLLRLLKSHPDT